MIVRSGSSCSRTACHSREARIHECEILGSGAGVLAEVHAPTCIQDDLVEAIEHPVEAGAAGGHVERERPAGHRERQHPRIRGTEAFQHREKRGHGRVTQLLDRMADCVLASERHDELILHQAAIAVHPVPVLDHVEGVKEEPEVLVGAAMVDAGLCGTRRR